MPGSYADFVRVGRGEAGSSIFVDLGDPTWRAIEINAPKAGIIVPQPDVHFRRWPAARTAPAGRATARLRLLQKYVNVEPAECRS